MEFIIDVYKRQGHTPADLYKAALEGTACAIRHVLSRNPKQKNNAVVMGGGINIPMLLQTVSDVTGCRPVSYTHLSPAGKEISH